MATTLPAGSLAISIIGKDVNFQQIIDQSTKSIKNFQQTIQNKSDILGGALNFMASKKDHTEDIADNTGTMVDLMREVARNTKDGGMTYV